MGVGDLRRLYRRTEDYILDFNTALENATRLSMYDHSRRAGLSPEESAGIARNLTVNFNRKGEKGRAISALYLFANPAIQGTAQVVKSMHSPKAAAAAGVLGLVGYIASEAARSVMGDDDDGEPLFDKIEDWKKERTIILPSMENPKEFGMVPMPYGYNMFYLVGQAISDLEHGKDPMKVALFLTRAAMNSFMPWSIPESDLWINQFYKAATPTVLLPGMELALNENPFGGTIRRLNHPNAKVKTPLSHMSKQGTPEPYKKIARGLNKLGGGTPVNASWLDVSAETLFHWMKFAGGSVEATLRRTWNAIEDVRKGKETSINNIPVLRRFKGEITHWDSKEIYEERIDEVNQALADLEYYEEYYPDTYEKEMGPEKMRMLDLEHNAESAEKEIRGLFKDLKELREDPPEDADQIQQEIYDEMNQAEKEFIKAWNDVMKPKKAA